MKAKDSAVGSSFDQHVVGGYRFLMRFYNPGDEIYIFGFSRGAYIARFLAEMLDYVGLLSHGNEEMVVFAWKAFSNWQSRQGSHTPEGVEKGREMYAFMKGFRETFSRPVRRIRFLGLFDTVNSVPRFETAWMERNKFPYTARTSAKVVRHAVAIDERRAKFRQDLIYQSGPQKPKKERSPAPQNPDDTGEKQPRRGRHLFMPPSNTGRGRQRSALDVPDVAAPYRPRSRSARSRRSRMTDNPAMDNAPHDAKSEVSVGPHPHDEDHEDSICESEDETEQDIDEVWFSGGHADIGGGWDMIPESKSASHVPLVWMIHEAMKAGLQFDLDKVRELGCVEGLDDMCMTSANQNQDTAGPQALGETSTADTAVQPPIPNIMVRRATSSTPKLFQQPSFNGPSNSTTTSTSSSSQSSSSPPTFKDMMHKAHTALIHDSLKFGGGLPHTSVLAWKIMEYVFSTSLTLPSPSHHSPMFHVPIPSFSAYFTHPLPQPVHTYHKQLLTSPRYLPFRRMDLQDDGTWRPIRWPLPCGEVRDIPRNARIHGSVIRRMQLDETYRPGNLIVGGGGRGVRMAPREKGIGEWVCVEREGCPVGEVWVRKTEVDAAAANGKGEKGR
jgi:uncharacterized protein (DUF2235 family)